MKISTFLEIRNRTVFFFFFELFDFSILSYFDKITILSFNFVLLFMFFFSLIFLYT